jgi:hypothetical protein
MRKLLALLNLLAMTARSQWNVTITARNLGHHGAFSMRL